MAKPDTWPDSGSKQQSILTPSISLKAGRHHNRKSSKGIRQPDDCLPLHTKTAKPIARRI
ncbi:hypothetical protein BB934_05505 [Microvirga ossetica]|uniref:Uncharacterized protein n=1 Tax=Microvirga ossetica TaxID=1882682 RepID=A0A1B2ECU1_9HYPH|nr:hypothetical protein BB934_05505 [Microvirga ossetica]